MKIFSKNRHITSWDIIIYIPIFSFLLSLLYNLQIEIGSTTSIKDTFMRLGEFSYMVSMEFFAGLSFSFISMILTLAVASFSNFRLLKSFWQFLTCHSIVTFLLFFALICHFSDDSDSDNSALGLILSISRLSIPYLISLPLAGTVTIAFTDIGTRYLRPRP